MSKYARFKVMAGLALAGVAAAGAQSQAAVVYMNMSALSTPTEGIAAFNGTNIVSEGNSATADTFTANRGVAPFATNTAHLEITSGFAVSKATIHDLTGNGVSNGDTVTASIGAGTFVIKASDGGTIVTGSFDSAVLNTIIGSSSVTINSSTANNLNLVVGQVLIDEGYTTFGPSESFALSIVGIDPGVQTAGAVTRVGTTAFYKANLAAFGGSLQAVPTSGSVDLVANTVPEPASLGLLGLGALAFVARRRRSVMTKLIPSSLAVAGLMMACGGGTKAEAGVVYMNFSDINNPTTGLAGYNSATSKFQSLGDKDVFTISGAVSHQFPNDVTFQIIDGFDVTNTYLLDTNNNGPETGEVISSDIGDGTAVSHFKLTSASQGDLILGSFVTASLSTAVNASTVTLNSSDITGLQLTPGAALTSLGILSLNPVESFSLSITGIAPGIQVSNIAPLDPSDPNEGIYTATLGGFGIGQTPTTAGSIDLVANAVVPEPASLGLLGVGAVGLMARRRRQA